MIKKINNNIYQIGNKKFGSHSYLIKDKNITIIDPGMITSFKDLKQDLEELKIDIKDVKYVINTHEHIDHVSSMIKFKDSEIVAHEKTAKRIETSSRILKLIGMKLKIDKRLKNNEVLNLGKYKLKAIYTPGHSIGSCCFYEEKTKFLFSGDTLFAYGTPALITPSGSKNDYLKSLKKLLKLDIKKILPGHGHLSENPKKDIQDTIKNI